MAASASLMHVATTAYALNLTLTWPLYAHVENIALILTETIYYPAIFIPLFLIPLYFPDGQLLSPRWRLLVALILFILIWSFVATAIRPWPVPETNIDQTRTLNVQVQAQDLPPLPAAIEVATFRIVQEALNNVVKHAQAHACIITIGVDDALHALIDDDGIGYFPANVPGVGLISIHERAAELGGHCAVRQRPSGGTPVEVLLPLVLGGARGAICSKGQPKA